VSTSHEALEFPKVKAVELELGHVTTTRALPDVSSISRARLIHTARARLQKPAVDALNETKAPGLTRAPAEYEEAWN
jgi:hypothetical protein